MCLAEDRLWRLLRGARPVLSSPSSSSSCLNIHPSPPSILLHAFSVKGEGGGSRNWWRSNTSPRLTSRLELLQQLPSQRATFHSSSLHPSSPPRPWALKCRAGTYSPSAAAAAAAAAAATGAGACGGHEGLLLLLSKQTLSFNGTLFPLDVDFGLIKDLGRDGGKERGREALRRGGRMALRESRIWKREGRKEGGRESGPS